MTVADVVSTLHAWAPPGQKADFDRVGLQVGDPAAYVDRVLVALDLTPQVVDEAAEAGAQLIVTHHPLLFKPVGRVTANDPVGSLAWRLGRAGISYVAIHTNLDAARGGVSFALAEQLGIRDSQILAPLDGVMRKVVVFAPREAADAVRQALTEAGAGEIGDYRACSFTGDGTGRFRPEAGASPHLGMVGEDTEADEVRIEAVVPQWAVGAVRRAVAAAHPYEEPALDIYPLEGRATRQGYGVVGRLDAPERLPAFLARVRDALGAGALRYVGDDDQTVERVAVCGGAGLSFLPAALAAGADAYVTADVTYHRFFEALDTEGRPRMALVDAGHYETEAITERLIADRLRAEHPELAVDVTATRTSPMRTFTGA
ncbi:Nif3-like dinuclear metal center hexameric protein [Rubrivirga marina]|uniref:GTP cyclohydrolase 1 type 2 homolog n=1 Tax=Rubrivirga marina TaxID=1196024 RepID=A0A271J1K7_9BACT|nr:Nif3-like dinuclear metal center hexameric protein [Rubrivirga marina]PAP77396.1 Nif3-like dinuclear metal center hexameric protein [Rubrivirga marina]